MDVRHNVSIVLTFRDWRFCSVRGCFDKKFGNNSVRVGDVAVVGNGPQDVE